MECCNSFVVLLYFFLYLFLHFESIDCSFNEGTCINDAHFSRLSSLVYHQHEKLSLEHDTLAIASVVKEKVANQGYAWIDSNLFRKLLKSFGAIESELIAIERGWIHSQLQPMASEPKLFFRDSASHSLLLDDTKDHIKDSYISTNYPTVTITTKDELSYGNNEKIKTEVNGIRVWNTPPKEFIGGSVSLAMSKLHKLFLPEIHQPQSNMNMLSNTTINIQDLFRVNKHLAEHAAPSTEGIHQDGFEITSVTLIKRHNVRSGGETRIWNLQQPIGFYRNADFGESNNTTVPDIKGFKWSNILFRKTMTQPWETIVINDRKVKHEGRAFYSKEKGKPCYRDVIINNMRKPYLGGIDKMRIGGKIVDVI